MGHHVLAGNPPVELTLRRSPRARRISLRVSGLDGQVTLTLPPGIPERDALDFAQSKGDWLRSQLSARPQQLSVMIGGTILLEGREVRIAPCEGNRVRVADDVLCVPGDVDCSGRRVQAWMKTRARDALAAASDHYSRQIGRTYTRLTLRDTRSRWGSCTAKGGLMYSWRLIMAPPEVLNYVAAHEVAHLAEMNHSPAFWGVVASLMPNYHDPRLWLRENGASLHRFRFGD